MILAFSTLALMPLLAFAGPVTGTVVGGLTQVAPGDLAVTQGQLIDPTDIAGLGSNPFLDNTNTAVLVLLSASSTPGGGPMFVLWGDTLDTQDAFLPSALIFEGFPVENAPEGIEVPLGRFTFLNGNSEVDKLIFGLRMELDVLASDDPNVDPLTVELRINTTVNFSQIGIDDADYDADFITISQVLDPSVPPGIGQIALPPTTTLHAFEGQAVQAILYGTFYGDPMLALTNIALDPLAPVGGFVGNGPLPVPAAVPEPSTLTMLAVGLVGVLGWRYRKRIV